MKSILLAIFIMSLVPTAHADRLRVKGELVIDSGGVGQLTECGTQRHLVFGVMASNPYFHFVQRYEQVAGAEKQPVLVEVEGTLARSSNGKLVLNSPRVISIMQGKCSGG